MQQSAPPAASWCAVIPAYREARHIGPVVEAVRGWGATVLVVDDGSPDDTARVAEAAGAVVLRHPVNRGKGVALQTGFQEALRRGCAFVVTLDADGQHDPADLPNFLDAFRRTGIPVLIGNRMGDTAAMPWLRRITNRVMSRLLSSMMGHYIPDTQCGYRLYRNDVLTVLASESPGFAAESEVLLRLAARGVRMDAVRVRTIYRDECSSIRPVRDTWRFVCMLARYRRAGRVTRATAPVEPE
jgi:glycosyltransferase involved in cell wall biosynthesis